MARGKGVGIIETATISSLVEEVRDEVVGWRRHLHRNPELSFEEKETSRFVYETLESFGDLELSKPTPTSVVARLAGSKPGRTVALRADMDALPITEENDFECVSENEGVMHACGHDGHTAMLLGTAKILSGMKEEIKGEVRFIFQHAEELYPGGAQEMVHGWRRLLGLPAGDAGALEKGVKVFVNTTFRLLDAKTENEA